MKKQIICIVLLCVFLCSSLNVTGLSIKQEDRSLEICTDNFDMVIIAPENYRSNLDSLINHKNSVAVYTFFKSTEDIYNNFQGRDEPEKIKYFIKDAIEIYNISYVLLVGSIDLVPIRFSYYYEVITDLYYADIYFKGTTNFCSWDKDNDDKFGEIDDWYDMDFYPDVCIGRLACTSNSEVSIVVDKIINYETKTYGSSWFNNMILMGGNTLPSTESLYNEGEGVCEHIIKLIDDFTLIKIYASDNLFNPRNINRIVSDGAGFLVYSGHGVPNGIITYSSKATDYYPWYMKSYMDKNIKNLNNGYKLPIMYFEACLTAKLDWEGKGSKSEPKTVFRSIFHKISFFHRLSFSNNLFSSESDSDYEPCFAWKMVSHAGGGAIATIGATRIMLADSNIGGNEITFKFFKAYEENITLGDMMKKAQISYINKDPMIMSYTIQEIILLGDPSLKIGGYS